VAVISTAPAAHRIDARLYDQIVACGALDDARVELIDGIIVEMSPHSPAHAEIIRRLTAHLGLAKDLVLSVQLPLEAAGDSVPEPDLALIDAVRPRERHPQTGLLVVEVAVSSLAIDRGRKADLYAAAGVSIYWLVDLAARAVEVRTDPGPTGYRTLRTLEPGALLESPCAGVGQLAVSALLEGL